jgi:hypothetical protein
MKTIESYEAVDGTKFHDRAQCERYEADLRRIAHIKIPNSKLDHGKYKQHDVESLLAIKRALWTAVLEKYGERWPEWRGWKADDVHPMSVVGRCLDDCSGPIERAWAQLARFNFLLGREYDQPYFALNPNEAVEAQ